MTIPLVIALILACAFAPVMRWMRRRGVPSVLATVITLLAIVLLLSGVGWLIVWAVRDQWDDLYAQAQEGFQALIAWVQTLPFAPTQDQLDEWMTTVTDFVTSAQFGSGALAGVGAVANFVDRVRAAGDDPVLLPEGRAADVGVPAAPVPRRALSPFPRIGDKTVTVLGSYVRARRPSPSSTPSAS